MLFGHRTSSDGVQKGDVFRKAGTYGGEWVVDCVFEYPDIPRHVRLVARNAGRAMTVAADLLFDPEFFTPIQSAPNGETL